MKKILHPLYWMYLLSRLTYSLVMLVYWVFAAIKWMLAPVAILFDFLILFPIGKFSVSMPVRPAFAEIDSAGLPLEAWCHFEATAGLFKRFGFTTGKIIASDEVIAGYDVYVMMLVNHADGMACAINYYRFKKAKNELMDLNSCEFTCVSNGQVVDLCNTTITEPFLPMLDRTRLVLRDLTDSAIYRIFKEYVQASQGQWDEETLLELQNNPRQICSNEYNMMMQSNVKRGYLYENKHGRYYTTWKGAWVNTCQTLWPFSVWYRSGLEKQARDFFADADIDVETIEWAGDGYETFAQIDAVETMTDVVTVVDGIRSGQMLSGDVVGFSIELGWKDSQPVIHLVNVSYVETKDFPGRKSKWFCRYEIGLNNQDHTADLRDAQGDISSHEDIEEYDLEDEETFSVNPESLCAPHEIVKNIVLYVQQEIDEKLNQDMDVMLLLESRSDQLVWYYVWYGDESETVFYIDAKTGDLLSTETTAY